MGTSVRNGTTASWPRKPRGRRWSTGGASRVRLPGRPQYAVKTPVAPERDGAPKPPTSLAPPETGDRKAQTESAQGKLDVPYRRVTTTPGHRCRRRTIHEDGRKGGPAQRRGGALRAPQQRQHGVGHPDHAEDVGLQDLRSTSRSSVVGSCVHAPPIPALLTSTSSRPVASSSASAAARTLARGQAQLAQLGQALAVIPTSTR